MGILPRWEFCLGLWEFCLVRVLSRSVGVLSSESFV